MKVISDLREKKKKKGNGKTRSSKLYTTIGHSVLLIKFSYILSRKLFKRLLVSVLTFKFRKYD